MNQNNVQQHELRCGAVVQWPNLLNLSDNFVKRFRQFHAHRANALSSNPTIPHIHLCNEPFLWIVILKSF